VAVIDVDSGGLLASAALLAAHAARVREAAEATVIGGLPSQATVGAAFSVQAGVSHTSAVLNDRMDALRERLLGAAADYVQTELSSRDAVRQVGESLHG
jgi:hypothetical protein